MRKILIGLCLILASNFAWCKSKNAWENLNTLQAGDKVQIVEKDRTKVSGAFVSVNPQGITLYEKSGKASIEESNVVRVRLGGQRMRHLLIGIGIGAGSGAAWGAVDYNGCNNCAVTRGAAVGAGILVGVAVGAVVGGLMPDYKTVYQVAKQ